MNVKAVVFAMAVGVATGVSAVSIESVTSRTLWQKGDNGYDTYRIPAVVSCTDGTLLAFCEGRKGSSGDSGDVDVVVRRSADGGATWGAQQVVWSDGANTCGNPVPIVDQASGRVVLAMTWNLGTDGETAIINKTAKDTRRVFVAHSDDNGATWSSPAEITSSVKSVEWGWYATGPGGGIQLRNGAHAGRLVVPCDHSDAAGAYCSHVIYSDDAGATWQLGGTVPDVKLNECQVAELSDGRLLLNMRNYNRTVKARRISFSGDAGATWWSPVYDAALIEPICQASLERVRWPQGTGAGLIAFSNPASESSRVNLTLRLSTDDAATWAVNCVLCADPSAYSDLAVASSGKIVALYECGVTNAYEQIRAAQVTLSESAVTSTSSVSSSSSVSDASISAEGLQTWFRADQNVNGGTVADGEMVSSWASSAGDTPLAVSASASARPVWVQNAFQHSDGAWSSAVRFNRDASNLTTVAGTPQVLESTSTTSLALTNDSSWFVVMRLATNHQERGVFGLVNSGVTPTFASRFGAFFLTTSPDTLNRLRTHSLCNGSNPQGDLQTNVALLVDCRRSGSASPVVGARLNGALFGTDTASTTFTNTPSATKFRIGDQHLGSPKNFIGDIAEVIVYNRALNDAERVILQNALAARYGLSLAANDLYTGKSAANGDFDLDVVGIGRYADDGVAASAGAATNSGCSAGLRLQALNDTLGTNGEFLFAGHRSASNAWTDGNTDSASCALRWTRVWRVQKISTDGIDARLSFDFNVAGGGAFDAQAAYRLVYRRSSSESFSALPVTPAVVAGMVSFDVPNSSLVDGEYTLGLGGTGGVTYPQSGISDGLTLWFRADLALTGTGATNGAPVNAWANYGSIGTSADVSAAAVSNAPVFISNGFDRATGVYLPVVRFNWDTASSLPTADNQQRLTTGSNTTDFNVKTDSTWFVVFKTLTNNVDQGLFGSSEATSRFGAFFVATSPNRIRLQNNMYTQQNFEYNVTNNTLMLMDSRRFGPTNAAFISYRGNGAAGGDSALVGSNLFSAVKAQFRIGNQHFTTSTNNFVGDIAEIRIYNRAVNDAERIIIQNHLAARYGKTLWANDLYTGKNAAQGDYDLDMIGIGCMTAAGTAALPGSVTDSGDAAGLRLVALNGTLANNNEFVFAGHRTVSNAWTAADTDGATCSNRWTRDWYINRASFASASQSPNDGVDVRLVFNRLVAGGGDAVGNYRLLFRRTLAEPFAAFAVNGSENGSQVSFDLTGDALVNGYYTLGTGAGTVASGVDSLCSGVSRSLRVWFRASDACALSGSTVTNWGNLGEIGASLDVRVGAGSPQWIEQGFLRASGAYQPVVRFDGSSRLVSTVTSVFDVVENASWFAVFKPTGASRANTGLFGTDSETTRFGGFFTGTSSANYPLRYHMFNPNDGTQFCQATNVQQSVVQLADYRRLRLSSSYAISAYMNGSVSESKTGSQATPSGGRLKIGHMLSDGSAVTGFVGDFAELRIYNRAVLDPERVIIQNHLAARYGASLATNDVYAGKSAVSGDCDLDVVGIGCTTNAAAGACPGAVAASDASAGLVLAALNGSLGDGEYLLAGHNSPANRWIRGSVQGAVVTYRWQREWFLDKTSTDGLDARLTFDFAAAGVAWRPEDDRATYRLLWRTDASSAYEDAGLEPSVSGDTLAFDVPSASLSDGLYTVGALLPLRGTMVLVR